MPLIYAFKAYLILFKNVAYALKNFFIIIYLFLPS
uniref:Uncharacterized protein n=1 Tax=Myoviridae sp. ctcyQ27 TaxID=2825139 RepID=A0A8S5UFE4_9CAUD|nr:MAG TPA: hypothetical protein [Myoviridae sp. ctcyQ27]